MFRRLLTVFFAAATLVGTTVVFAGAGYADTPHCVTQAELQRVVTGTRIERAHRIFDTHGWFLDGGAGGFARRYRFCDPAQRRAGTSYFTVIYLWKRDDSIRVYRKYCGRDYDHRRACF
jgi:hypothetical protein